MLQFPVNIKTHDCNEAIVTNPEDRIYHFEVISPKDFESFTLRDNLLDEPLLKISGMEYPRSVITAVHTDLMQFFRFEQEKHLE